MTDLLRTLSDRTGLGALDLRHLILSAPDRYKNFQIPKQNGQYRKVSQPAREVKILQRTLVETVLTQLDVHPAARAYRIGKSIRDNALVHSGVGPVLKYDFKDFFPSIRDHDWVSYCHEKNIFDSEEDITLSSYILFHRARRSSVLRLAIGAPSSPILSNILMFKFDEAITDAVAPEKIRYSRYADDLTFSAPRTGYLNVVDRRLRAVLKDLQSPRLKINEDKTILATRKYKRMVTGLILANDGSVTIGRKRKHNIRAGLYQWSLGRLDHDQRLRLAGLLAFTKGAEPDFFHRIASKHGQDIIDRVRGQRYEQS